MLTTALRERLHAGDAVLGTILPIPSPDLAEIIGLAGYDCIMLDTEHGSLTTETLAAMVRACHAANVVPLARVPENHPKQILRVLDSGCVGVMVPQIETPEQAAAAVAATKYPPQGIRSLAGATPAARWGTVPVADHVAVSNAATIAVLQVETRRGLDAVEEIARIPGIDVLFIGPSDLSVSLGHPGEMSHADVQAGVRQIIETGHRAGVPMGILALTADEVRTYRSMGIALFLDSAPRLLLRAARAQVQGMREAATQGQPLRVSRKDR